jgi:glycolate oxidase iron-sulfur subunit
MKNDLLDACVHCGFCLPACPTYESWGEEMDSPRGRIDLMRALAEGEARLTPTVVGHFDRCLGCMACVTACPSGVRYDVLIEQTRAAVERGHRRPRAERWFRAFLFALLPYPRRLRLALIAYVGLGLRWLSRRFRLGRFLPRRLASLEALAPDVGLGALVAGLPARTPARGTRRARVALLAGCVQRVAFPGVNQATLRVLAAEGCEVLVPPGLGCCGALSLHAGRADEARRLARAALDTLAAAEVDAVVVNAAGCGSAMKEWGALLADDPRAAELAAKVRDVSEFLVELGAVAPRGRLELSVAYHDACHLAHAQRVRAQPRALLAAIPGLELRELGGGDACCGSAGIYNLVEPESARPIGLRKVEHVLAADADVLASANPGCTLHLARLLAERGRPLRTAHPIELLDDSIRRGTGTA